RFDNGGSGAFVSSDGLTITNHHLAQDCLQGLSHSSQDFFRPAFYASRPKDELRCPSLELNVVDQISDVTDKINATVRTGLARPYNRDITVSAHTTSPTNVTSSSQPEILDPPPASIP